MPDGRQKSSAAANVNGKQTMDVTTSDLETMTEPELRDLISAAQAALDRQVALRAKSTLKEIRRLAAEVGFEVNFARAGKAAGGRSAAARAASPRGKAVQKYRNPENPAETWSGRGRPPKWVQAAQDAGQTLEDLLIPGVGAEAA
jgi:DNA-binding protein H-NS